MVKSGYWTGLNQGEIKWGGDIYAEKFIGDGSLITGIAGGGDVTKVGTPANDQIGVWTGNGTIEGTSSLTYDGTVFNIGAGAAGVDYSLKFNGQDSDGNITFDEDNAKFLFDQAIDIAGNITLSGTVDGVDVAAHAADTTDPHGQLLTQTYIALASGAITADSTVSGAALIRNILIGTEASPGAASNWTQGTIYLKYTA